MYKNELLSFQQKRNLTKSKKKRYSREKATENYLQSKKSIKEK